MTLAPIRGAPPGASIPDFPSEEPNEEPIPPTTTPVPGDQGQVAFTRQPHTPIEISGSHLTLTFRVIPEQPAISRASMTIRAVAETRGQSSGTLGFLRMSAVAARSFLTALKDDRSPIVATGDEGGTVEVVYVIAESGPAFLIRDVGGCHVVRHLLIHAGFDISTMTNGLLADLGA